MEDCIGTWDWVQWFAETMHCNPWAEVTRIEWRYLEP